MAIAAMLLRGKKLPKTPSGFGQLCIYSGMVRSCIYSGCALS